MFNVLNRNLRYLFVVNFVFGFSIQLITPLFPLFLSELGASTAENASVISIGALVSTALMLPSGLLIDKIGRKVLLIGSAVVNMISIYMMSQVSTCATRAYLIVYLEITNSLQMFLLYNTFIIR